MSTFIDSNSVHARCFGGEGWYDSAACKINVRIVRKSFHTLRMRFLISPRENGYKNNCYDDNDDDDSNWFEPRSHVTSM